MFLDIHRAAKLKMYNILSPSVTGGRGQAGGGAGSQVPSARITVSAKSHFIYTRLWR